MEGHYLQIPKHILLGLDELDNEDLPDLEELKKCTGGDKVNVPFIGRSANRDIEADAVGDTFPRSWVRRPTATLDVNGGGFRDLGMFWHPVPSEPTSPPVKSPETDRAPEKHGPVMGVAASPRSPASKTLDGGTGKTLDKATRAMTSATLALAEQVKTKFKTILSSITSILLSDHPDDVKILNIKKELLKRNLDITDGPDETTLKFYDTMYAGLDHATMALNKSNVVIEKLNHTLDNITSIIIGGNPLSDSVKLNKIMDIVLASSMHS